MFRTLTILLTLLASADVATARAERYVYELKVAGKKFDVTLGERFELALPGGRPFALLRRAPTTWSGRGIRFSHPGDMKVAVRDHSAVMGTELVGIDVSRGKSLTVMMLLRPREKMTPEKAVADAVQGLRMFEKRRDGGDMKETPWREKFAGESRKGVRLTATSGEDPTCAGVFALAFGGRTLVIGFRSPRSRWEEGLAAFRMVATSLAVAKDAEGAEAAAEFELKVGKRSYAIDVDRAFLIEGPDGKELKATLVAGEKTYAGSGIEFEYPGDMTTRTEPKHRRVMIHVEHGDEYFATLQLFLVPGIDREQVQSLAVKHVRSGVERTGAEFGPEKSCRRRVCGKLRTGTRLVTEGVDDPHLIEIYSFEIGKRVISVLLFFRESNQKTAKKAFQKIAKSLSDVD